MAQVAQTSPFFALTSPAISAVKGAKPSNFGRDLGYNLQIYTRLFSQRLEGAIGHGDCANACA